MEVVGLGGFTGQNLIWIDTERYAFISGNGMCIADVNQGPAELVWKCEAGLSAIASNFTTKRIAVAHDRSNNTIEILSSTTCESVIKIPNPARGKVTDVAFNTDGTRLVFLTDFSDHQIVVWDLQNNRQLVSQAMSTVYKRCAINPVNSDAICLYGDYGAAVGTVQQYLDEFVVTVAAIDIPIEVRYAEGINRQSAKLDKSVRFGVWGPQMSLFLGTKDGFLMEVKTGSKEVRIIANTSAETDRGSLGSPRAAQISASHLIVATSEGALCWYPLFAIYQLPWIAEQLEMHGNKVTAVISYDLISPVQIARSDSADGRVKPIVSLAQDPSFTALIFGTSCGSIHCLSSDYKPPMRGDQDDHDVSAELDTNTATSASLIAEFSVSATLEFHDGVPLCATTVFFPVLNGDADHKHAQFTAIGSHRGTLSFWHFSSSDAIELPKAITGPHAHSGPAPRIPKLVGKVHTVDNAAITAVEQLGVGSKGGSRLIAVGTTTGWLEVYLAATIFDDQGQDDEDSVKLTVNAALVSRRRLFLSAISAIALSPIHPYIAVMSINDSNVYIFNFSFSSAFQHIDLVSTTSCDALPISCTWTKDNLLIFTKSGKVISFDCQSKTVKEYGFSHEHGAVWQEPKYLHNVLVGKADAASVFVSMTDTRMLTIISKFPSLENVKGIDAESLSISSFASLSCSAALPDVALCVAVSIDGHHLAAGCADGSVLLFSIKRTGSGEVSLNHTSTKNLHNAAVLSLCFTPDSSYLISCGADSGIFSMAVGRTLGQPIDKVRFEIDDKELHRYKAAEDEKYLRFDGDRVLSDYRAEEAASELQLEFSDAIGSIREDANNIAHRLETLLTKNSKVDELERMELSEFVIDLEARDEIMRENQERANEIVNRYKNENSTNELIAARIRRDFWDHMEQHVKRLLPFNNNAPLVPSESNFSSAYLPCISSFPVRAFTEEEQKQIHRIMRLRAVEIRFQRSRSGQYGQCVQLPNGAFRANWEADVTRWIDAGLSWILNEGARWPSVGVIDDIIRREKERLEDDAGTAAGAQADAKGTTAADAGTVTTLGNDDDEGHNRTGGVDENTIFSLLLPPTSVRTVVQKRNQIMLLKEYCRQIKMKFNAAFEKLSHEKDDNMAAIAGRNTRIQEIFAELGISEELRTFHLHDIEMSGSDIKLSKGDVTVVPYESEAARAERLRLEEEKRRRDAEADKANVKGRALQDMMNGVLEVKKEASALEVKIVPPSWYVEGMTPDKMNESQKKEFEEFDAKRTAAEEEKAKYRKSLEMELKKLKAEIVDTCKGFDEKLVQMSKLRMLVQRELLAEEMYMSNLSFSMVKREHLVISMKRLEQKVEEARVARNTNIARINHISAKLEDGKNLLLAYQEDERSLDRTFRRDLQTMCSVDLDQDTLKVLYQLYKIRHYPKKNGGLGDDEDGNDADGGGAKHASASTATSKNASRGGNMKSNMAASKDRGHNRSQAQSNDKSAQPGGGIGALQEAALALQHPKEVSPTMTNRNPFYKDIMAEQKSKLEVESNFPLMTPLNMDRDCPDGFNVDQFVWKKLQELRFVRIEREIESKKLSHDLQQLRGKLQRLNTVDAEAVAHIEEMQMDHSRISNEIARLDNDLCLVVSLRQGQDEVISDSVATDYSMAKLIPTTVIKSYNGRINELGRDKIHVLNKTKRFRRKMNMIAWEAVHMEKEAKHYEELYTDTQLLKVTRDLQRVVREGSNAEQLKARLEKIANRKHYLSTEFEKKIKLAKASNEELEQIWKERDSKNHHLEAQISHLAGDVDTRADVRKGRGPIDDEAKLKMKKIVARRHLIDRVKVQADQINMLKGELEKLREKTFPSFVKATKTRLAINPDDRFY